MHASSQNSISQESIRVLSWNFQRILKGDGHPTKKQYMHTAANTTVTATTTFVATTCEAKSIEMRISRIL